MFFKNSQLHKTLVHDTQSGTHQIQHVMTQTSNYYILITNFWALIIIYS